MIGVCVLSFIFILLRLQLLLLPAVESYCLDCAPSLQLLSRSPRLPGSALHWRFGPRMSVKERCKEWLSMHGQPADETFLGVFRE